jgi:heptosyltransferase-1
MSFLVIRLGAMGDVIHTLPAVSALKRTFPEARLAWAIERRWSMLLEKNPYVDRIIEIDRGSIAAIRRTYGNLQASQPDVAVDFQGLFKSAAVAFFSGAARTIGFDRTRERPAAVFYTRRVEAQSIHVVERNLELAAACGAGNFPVDFPLPAGIPEGELPDGPFVLASPLAGWRSKQWPIENYSALAKRLDMPLVLNGPPAAEAEMRAVPGCRVHLSGIAGLIHATRRAGLILGLDSGPLQLAAALGKPGVALFGPTDPARNGPYGGSIRVIRSPEAITSYKRRNEIDLSMRAISPEAVLAELQLIPMSRSAGNQFPAGCR